MTWNLCLKATEFMGEKSCFTPIWNFLLGPTKPQATQTCFSKAWRHSYAHCYPDDTCYVPGHNQVLVSFYLFFTRASSRSCVSFPRAFLLYSCVVLWLYLLINSIGWFRGEFFVLKINATASDAKLRLEESTEVESFPLIKVAIQLVSFVLVKISYVQPYPPPRGGTEGRKRLRNLTQIVFCDVTSFRFSTREGYGYTFARVKTETHRNLDWTSYITSYFLFLERDVRRYLIQVVQCLLWWNQWRNLQPALWQLMIEVS